MSRDWWRRAARCSVLKKGRKAKGERERQRVREKAGKREQGRGGGTKGQAPRKLSI